MKYLVVYEQADDNYSSYAPDLPGCVTTGRTLEEAAAVMREAMAFHIDGLREDGDAIPEPSAQVGMVEAPGEPSVRYLVVYEKRPSGYEAHAPDLLPSAKRQAQHLVRFGRRCGKRWPNSSVSCTNMAMPSPSPLHR